MGIPHDLHTHAGAADMSTQDVSDVYNEVVRELSLNLALHEASMQQAAAAAGGAPRWQRAGFTPVQNMQAAFDR